MQEIAKMAAAFAVIEEDDREPRPPRIIKDYQNPIDSLSDIEVISEYRLTAPLIYNLCDALEGDIKGKTKRSVPVYLKVLAALDFYAHGTILRKAGRAHSMSKSTCWSAIHDVTEAICNIAGDHIVFPDTDASRLQVKEGFYDLAGFPNVLGAIDGTLVPIQAPSENEHHFVCRKQFHAINVQCIGDANLMILNLVAKWPGSTHDAFIWTNSDIGQQFQDGEIGSGWLLGDSAYPLRPWILTPILNPTNAAQRRYNRLQKLARCVIERLFGILKLRFRCLHKTGGCLTYLPEMCCKIITAVGVLHNMCRSNNVPMPDEDDDEDDHDDQADFDDLQPPGLGDRADGVRVRQHLIAARFTH